MDSGGLFLFFERRRIMSTENSKEPCHVLLAIDGSEHAYAAAALLQDLPLPQACTIRAVGVFPPREAGNLHLYYKPLDKIEKDFHNKGIPISTELLAGSPAEVIIETAQVNPTDLIVLGAKGLRATLGILLGGVAQQVVEYSSHPVLIVRAPYTGIRRVLLVTDGSPHSQQAVEYLGQFRLPKGTELTALFVLPPHSLPQTTINFSRVPIHPSGTVLAEAELANAVSAMEQEEEEAGQALLRKTVDRLNQIIPLNVGIQVSSSLARGDAATEIIHYVKNHQVDLIIAGSLGASKGKGWKLGSVSRKLLHYAGCSVLIVREPGQVRDH
jgi:nucleotide-binding universal stress UspA family protein